MLSMTATRVADTQIGDWQQKTKQTGTEESSGDQTQPKLERVVLHRTPDSVATAGTAYMHALMRL
jgi:hypothetical protein